MKAIIEVSVREAGQAFWAIEDCNMLRDRLIQTASNVWETEDFGCDEEDGLSEIICDVDDLLNRTGVKEFDITKED